METSDSIPEIHAVPPSRLPDRTKREMDFLESSFFNNHQHLPTPTQVRALSSDIYKRAQPKPVVIENLNVLVKFGCYVTVAEAQCLWMIDRTFHGTVPVPEIFGWRIDEKDYVNLDKSGLCDQLCQIISSLRQPDQDSIDKYIGSINRQPLLDYVFQTQPEAGPFLNIKDFNDWFSSLPQLRLPISERYKDPYRDMLPDTREIKFTHADLHRGNIIVSSTAPARILAIVDWEQAGWYPDYWEYYKALYTCWYEDEWRRDFIDKCLSPRMEEFMACAETTMAIGAV